MQRPAQGQPQIACVCTRTPAYARVRVCQGHVCVGGLRIRVSVVCTEAEGSNGLHLFGFGACHDNAVHRERQEPGHSGATSCRPTPPPPPLKAREGLVWGAAGGAGVATEVCGTTASFPPSKALKGREQLYDGHRGALTFRQNRFTEGTAVAVVHLFIDSGASSRPQGHGGVTTHVRWSDHPDSNRGLACILPSGGGGGHWGCARVCVCV